MPNGDGCIRTIGFAPASAGDGALSFSMQRLMRRIAAPCGEVIDPSPVPGDALSQLVVPPGTSPPEATTQERTPQRWLAIGLLLAGVLLLLAEWYVRSQATTTGLKPVGAR